MKYWLVGGQKYDDLLSKNANTGEEVVKQRKGEIFTVLWRKNIIMEKGGGAKNIIF